MAYKCKIFVAVTKHFMGFSVFIDAHKYAISKVIGINKAKEMCLPKRE